MDLKTLETKMTSLEISQLTGKQHKDVLKDIRDETSKIGEDKAERIFSLGGYIDKNNQKRPMYVLTKEGVLQLAARYDAVVRFKLIEKVSMKNNLSLPHLILQQAQCLVEMEERLGNFEEGMVGVKKGISRLEHNQRRTLTSNHLTVIAYANMKNIHPKSYNASVIGKKATKLCKEKGYLTGAIVDSKYGTINTYPMEILDEVFF